jgi:LmbE family N-acetylglucosaminyl deacetylase
MQGLRFGRVGTILCLGAHSDDIEIGAGATLLRLVRENPEARIVWVVCSARGVRGTEAELSAARFLEGAGKADVILKGFRDGHFPGHFSEIKAFFETLKATAPDLVLTHFGGDLHQDHRVVSELTWNTFRDHTILEYEIPKWDGGLGSPNLFVPASVADADRKIELLTTCFASQLGKHWFDDLTFRGLMRLRGLECNAPEHLAEGFYARKITLGQHRDPPAAQARQR